MDTLITKREAIKRITGTREDNYLVSTYATTTLNDLIMFNVDYAVCTFIIDALFLTNEEDMKNRRFKFNFSGIDTVFEETDIANEEINTVDICRLLIKAYGYLNMSKTIDKRTSEIKEIYDHGNYEIDAYAEKLGVEYAIRKGIKLNTNTAINRILDIFE